MTSLVLTITETLRYRGKLGQWSWVLHRVSGVGTLVFLIMHVIDTSWATFYPELYAHAIAAYKTPLFTVGEFILVACVVYHALNGFRIVVFDFRPQWWKHQANAAKAVFGLTLLILIPAFLIMFGHVANHYNEHAFDLGLQEVITAVSPFAVGTVVVMGLALVVSLVAGFVPGLGGMKAEPKKVYKRSNYSKFMWSFMRISGVMIIPLVFGHLGMMHLVQGVFDITRVGHVPVGTTIANSVTGLTAVEFVRLRWDFMLAGVYIWRIYDILLLALVVVHGFNGAKYVMDDYFRQPVLRRALTLASAGTMIGLLVVGAGAILLNVPATTQKMIETSSQLLMR